jgi:hypothetical protein
MAERKKPYDLRERLLLFGKGILEICKKLPKLTSQLVEKEVNPAFQNNNFELGIWDLSLPKGSLWEKGCLPVGRQAHGRIYFELWILNFGF